jgi:hypothetical protein
MFTGFPSTITPNVKWWNLATTRAGTTTISLENDCSPVQYFATGGSTTAIKLYLPICPADGKTITITNLSYVTSTYQAIQIFTGNGSPNITSLPVITLGSPQTVTLCFIAMNTQGGANNNPSQWVSIGNTSLYNTFQNQAWVGGTNNTARDGPSVVCGGAGNIASASHSFVGGGTSNTASGSFAAVAGGNSNTAGGQYSSVTGGQSNNASSTGSVVAGGESNTASGSNSAILGGRSGTTRSIVGNIVSAASEQPISTTQGGNQLAMLVLARQTTDATATVLASDSSAASGTNQITLPNNSAYFFKGQVIAGVTGAGDTKGWSIEGVIKRGANAAATSLVGTPTVTSLYADAGAATWAVAVTANTTLGCITITVTGQATTIIRWVAQINTTEMTY